MRHLRRSFDTGSNIIPHLVSQRLGFVFQPNLLWLRATNRQERKDESEHTDHGSSVMPSRPASQFTTEIILGDSRFTECFVGTLEVEKINTDNEAR